MKIGRNCNQAESKVERELDLILWRDETFSASVLLWRWLPGFFRLKKKMNWGWLLQGLKMQIIAGAICSLPCIIGAPVQLEWNFKVLMLYFHFHIRHQKLCERWKCACCRDIFFYTTLFIAWNASLRNLMGVLLTWRNLKISCRFWSILLRSHRNSDAAAHYISIKHRYSIL